jgi:uncharacterized membrane protein AbrB (regulator of aidB expression)
VEEFFAFCLVYAIGSVGFDVKLRYIAQIGLGLAMGQRISPSFTALLGSLFAPAGLSQIGAFTEEVGADPFTASVFHTARIVGIVSLYPWIVLPLTG